MSLPEHLADLYIDSAADRLVDRLPKRARLRSGCQAAAEAEAAAAAPVKTVPSTLDHVLLTSYTYFDDDLYGGTAEYLGKTPTDDIEKAEMVSSRLVDTAEHPSAHRTTRHAPVLTVRYPRRVRLHVDEKFRQTHLTIDKPMSGWRYRRLLNAFHKAGLVATNRSRVLNRDQFQSVTFDLIVPAALATSVGQARDRGIEFTDLYLDAPMTWRTYKRLMRALVAADVIGSFWVKDAIRRGETRANVPWPIDVDHSEFYL